MFNQATYPRSLRRYLQKQEKRKLKVNACTAFAVVMMGVAIILATYIITLHWLCPLSAKSVDTKNHSRLGEGSQDPEGGPEGSSWAYLLNHLSMKEGNRVVYKEDPGTNDTNVDIQEQKSQFLFICYQRVCTKNFSSFPP